MFDDIPAPVALLIVIVIVAANPARYIFRYFTEAPVEGEASPGDDRSWRTRPMLALSIAWLVACIALAIFIFTPTAAEFAESAIFWPLIAAVAGAFMLNSVTRSLISGEVSPAVRGASWTFQRAAQPKRFWASVGWNALIGAGCLWLGFMMFVEIDETQCFDDEEAHSHQAQIAACSRAIDKADDPDAELIAERGILYHKIGDYRRALADYDRAIRLDPDDSNSRHNRGLLHARKGDMNRAIADYSAAIRLRPDYGYYMDRGIAYTVTGRFAPAIADFTHAHRLKPDDAWALAYRGSAYAFIGDDKRSRADLDRARQIDPTNDLLQRGEALLVVKQGDLQGTVERATAILKADPDDRWALRMRASAYQDLGEEEKAWDDLDHLWRLNSKSGTGQATVTANLGR